MTDWAAYSAWLGELDRTESHGEYLPYQDEPARASVGTPPVLEWDLDYAATVEILADALDQEIEPTFEDLLGDLDAPAWATVNLEELWT